MPFNDKGEFIRPEPSGPGRRASRRPVAPPIPALRPGGRPRLTTSADVRPPQRAAVPVDSTSPWEAIGALIGLVLLLAALAGVGWVLLLFHRWIVIALVLWVIHGVSNRLR